MASLSPPSRTLINDVATVVPDAIDGLLVTRPDLARLDGYPGTKVVMRRPGAWATAPTARVAVVCGGGSGHEPHAAGMVGAGMLHAAVCGDVFASPHVTAIVAAATALVQRMPAVSTPDGGLLFIVKNYTGDRLAFGLAAEVMRGRGVCVKTVVVADDVGVDGGPIVGHRGVAGTVLVYKVAGTLADGGESLDDVWRHGQVVADHLATMGASMSTCHVPGVPRSTRLDGDVVVELGLGIHGEPGATQMRTLPTSAALAAVLFKACMAKVVPAATTGGAGAVRLPLAVVINNLGGLSALEASVFVRSVLAAAAGGLDGHGGPPATIHRILCGHVMTALDMKGVSLTLLPLRPADVDEATALTVLSALDAPTSVPAWSAAWVPPCTPHPATDPWGTPFTVPATHGEADGGQVVPMPQPAVLGAATGAGRDGVVLPVHYPADVVACVHACVSTACAAVCDATTHLNVLDTAGGDGDCGTTMDTIAHTVRVVVDAWAGAPSSLASLLGAAAAGVSAAAGGTSGLLYALMLQAGANAVGDLERAWLIAAGDAGVVGPSLTPTPDQWMDALHHGLHAAAQAVRHHARANAGDRTLLDALLPAIDGLVPDEDEGGVLVRLQRAGAAAALGAEATASMAAHAGRAAYVPASVLAHHPDPGAVAVATWFTAAVRWYADRQATAPGDDGA